MEKVMKQKKAAMSMKVHAAMFLLLLLACFFGVPQDVAAAESVKLTKGSSYNFATSEMVNAVWQSSNPSVASVTGDGQVTASKKGTAQITATVDGVSVADYSVKVIKFEPVKMTKLQCYKKYRKYMSTKEFKKAYKAACTIVKPYAGFSKKEKLYAVASELRVIFDQSGTYSMTTKHYNDPYGYLIKHVASCAGCTRATGLCLNILGIKFEHVNEKQYTHQWARVKVGKEYWICDAFGLYVGKEPGKRKHPYL